MILWVSSKILKYQIEDREAVKLLSGFKLVGCHLSKSHTCKLSIWMMKGNKFPRANKLGLISSEFFFEEASCLILFEDGLSDPPN